MKNRFLRIESAEKCCSDWLPAARIGIGLGIGELHSPGYFLRLEIADLLFPAVGNRGSPAVVPCLEAELESEPGSANCIRRMPSAIENRRSLLEPAVLVGDNLILF